MTEVLPWVEKYRPTKLEEISSHQDIISTIDRFIEEQRLPHLLFYGPPGTGKTTTILACARKIFGANYRSLVLELNASDDRGIDVVRDQIKNFASTKHFFTNSVSSGNSIRNFKLIILDEADAMTSAAQAALRRVIEKYAKNVRFCLICNYVSKVIPAIQSRCTKFRFAPLPLEQLRVRLDFVVQSEQVDIDESGKKALLDIAKGDMRRVLNVLQAAATAYDHIDEAKIYECVGKPLPSDIKRILQWLLNEDPKMVYSLIREMQRECGLALQDIVTDITDALEGLEVPASMRLYLLNILADLERNLSIGCNENLQLAALVGGFHIGRSLTDAK